MALVGAFEAKTHLSAGVRKGEKITITRHGIPAAMLIPVEVTKIKFTRKEDRGRYAEAAEEDQG